jgi:hypothetical protein
VEVKELNIMPKYLTREQKVVNLAASDLLIVLQDAHLIFPYVEAPRKITPQTVWNCDEGTGETADVRITVRCLTCGLSEGRWNLPETFKIYHCGIVETTPPEIVKKFHALKKQQGY